MKKIIYLKFYKNFDLIDYEKLLKKLVLKKDSSFKKVIAFIVIWKGCFKLIEKYALLSKLTNEEEIIIYFITINR